MRLIIVVTGGRKVNNYSLISEELIEFIDQDLGLQLHEVCIAQGGAAGTDNLSRLFHDEYHLEGKPITLNADWNGKDKLRAGHVRNQKLLELDNLDGHKIVGVVSFWDGKSTGTQDMLTRAAKFCRKGSAKLKQIMVVKQKRSGKNDLYVKAPEHKKKRGLFANIASKVPSQEWHNK